MVRKLFFLFSMSALGIQNYNFCMQDASEQAWHILAKNPYALHAAFVH